MKTLSAILLSLFFFSRLSSQCSYICNGDFDNPFVTSGVSLVTSLTCWNTFGSDGKMEVWGTGFNGVPSYNGIQHVELNGTQAATMYQDFNVPSGALLAIGFAHRGRAGMDSMEVSIGPVSGPYTTLGRWGDGNTAWGYYTSNYTTSSAAMHRIRFTPVYWTGGNIAIGNFLDAISVSGGGLNLLVGVSNTLSCPAAAVSMTASGASSYSWTSGPSTAGYTVNPTVATIYTVTGSVLNGCTGVQTVTINIYNPTMTVSTTPTVCAGGNFTLSANTLAGSSFAWNGTPGQSTLVVSPAVSTIYSVTASSASLSVLCPISGTVQAIIKASPSITATATKTLVCKNSGSVVISALGGTSYTWAGGVTTQTNGVSSATAGSFNYSVTGTGSNGCLGTGTVQIKVVICEGIDENTAGSRIMIYPNPSKGTFAITSAIDMRLLLLNELGQLIKTIELKAGNLQQINLGNIAQGVYFLKGETAEGLFTRKVIVEN